VVEAVETQFVRNALAVLPITFAVTEPASGAVQGLIYGDDAAFHS
jgi:hypothetical protein